MTPNARDPNPRDEIKVPTVNHTLECRNCGPVIAETRHSGPHMGAYCPCGAWITWIPQGTAEERDERRRLAAMAGKPTTEGQRHLLTVTLDVPPADVPADRAEASRMIDRMLRERRGGAL